MLKILNKIDTKSAGPIGTGNKANFRFGPRKTHAGKHSRRGRGLAGRQPWAGPFLGVALQRHGASAVRVPATAAACLPGGLRRRRSRRRLFPLRCRCLPSSRQGIRLPLVLGEEATSAGAIKRRRGRETERHHAGGSLRTCSWWKEQRRGQG